MNTPRDVCPVAVSFHWERRIDRNWNPLVSISRGSLQTARPYESMSKAARDNKHVSRGD